MRLVVFNEEIKQAAPTRKRPRLTLVESVDDKAEAGPAPRLSFRVGEVAALLGVSRRTVERAIDDGRLASVKSLGVRLVRADSVYALLDAA